MSSHSSLSPEPAASFASPPVTIILTTVLLIFFFIGFFSIYFCRCFMDSLVSSLRRSPSGNLVNPANSTTHHGLDPSLVQLFPTFTYSNVKDFRGDKCGLECAICLAEFEDEDLLRLLTVCYHVFHQECIDLWLESHKTCPFCRRDLDLPRETLEKTLTLDHDQAIRHANGSNRELEHAVSIAIEEDNRGVCAGGNGERSARVSKENKRYKDTERFSRSNSTGHSIFATRGVDDDKYTLRLPEHVKAKVLRGHCTAQSCITFGDFSVAINGGLGEVSGCSCGDTKRV